MFIEASRPPARTCVVDPSEQGSQTSLPQTLGVERRILGKFWVGCSEPETFGNVYCALLNIPLY